MESKMEGLSSVNLYKIVDALNRTLEHNDLMFGLIQEETVLTKYCT